MKKMKQVLSLSLINLILMALMLYGFELLFSPYNTLPVNGKIKGTQYTWGHLVKNNKYGFRERDFENPKPPKVYRVMVLGDSLTWGAGLAIEERYTAITEVLLHAAFHDRIFEVLNFGVIGGPTTKEREILLKFQEVVKPDRIVVGFCLNDPQPHAQDYSIEREKLRKSLSGHTIHLLSQGMWKMGFRYVGTLVDDAFYRSAERLGIIPTWQAALQRTYAPLSREWQEFMRALQEIKSTSDELHLPSPIFVVLNQGAYTDKPTDYSAPDENLQQFLQWYHQAEKAAQDIGFTTYNHEHEIAHQLQNESLAINFIDGHPSTKLNRIYGERLYLEIAKQVTQQQ